MLNSARAAQRQSSGGPISHAVTPASIYGATTAAGSASPQMSHPELSSHATRGAKTSTEGKLSTTVISR